MQLNVQISSAEQKYDVVVSSESDTLKASHSQTVDKDGVGWAAGQVIQRIVDKTDVAEKPWAKVPEGQTKLVRLSPEAFRILCKFAAKRGLMVAKSPSDALEAMFKQFRVEETS